MIDQDAVLRVKRLAQAVEFKGSFTQNTLEKDVIEFLLTTLQQSESELKTFRERMNELERTNNDLEKVRITLENK